MSQSFNKGSIDIPAEEETLRRRKYVEMTYLFVGLGVGVLATVVTELKEAFGVVEVEFAPMESELANFFFIWPKRVLATLAFLNPAWAATRFQSTYRLSVAWWRIIIEL
jgi:hypothetical protein